MYEKMLPIKLRYAILLYIFALSCIVIVFDVSYFYIFMNHENIFRDRNNSSMMKYSFDS